MAVTDYYSIIAPGYEELYGEEQLKKFSEIDGFLSVSPGDSVLDVGCGTGLVTNLLAQEAQLVVGIDLANAMIAKAKKRTGPLYAVADAEALPFRDKAFDKVIALTSVQNAQNPTAVLLEILRVCKEKAAVTVPKRWAGVEATRTILSGHDLRIVEGERDIYFLATVG